MAYDPYASIASILADFETRIAAAEAGGTPTPAPAFTSQPTISPTSGNVGDTFTGTFGSVTNGSVTSRRWLLNGAAIGTGVTVIPNAAGSLVYENTATGVGTPAVSTSNPVTVAAAGVVTYSGDLPPATIGQPYDQSLTVTPNGSAITLDSATTSALAARGISHNGFGRFTSAGVTG